MINRVFRTITILSFFLYVYVDCSTLFSFYIKDSSKIRFAKEVIFNDGNVIVAKTELDKHLLLKNPYVFDIENEGEFSLEYSQALDLLDQTDIELDGNFVNSNLKGTGVKIFLMDSGINKNHIEFKNASIEALDFYSRTNAIDASDELGHGTFVASLLIGETVGVVPQADLTSIKIFGSSGRGHWGDVISGLNYIKDWLSKHKRKRCVINMSFSGIYSKSTNKVINRIKKLGGIFSVAAGNKRDDACKYSPGGNNGVYTIASMGLNNVFSPFSNRGPCVDFIMQGEHIRGASIEKYPYKFGFGTSYSTPFASAIMVQCMQKNSEKFRKCLMGKVHPNLADKTPDKTKNFVLKID